jgi:hypothetical protein
MRRLAVRGDGEMYGGDVLIVFESDLAVAPYVRSRVDEVRAAGTRIVVEHRAPEGARSIPWRLHFSTRAAAARVLTSASRHCRDAFRVDPGHGLSGAHDVRLA